MKRCKFLLKLAIVVSVLTISSSEIYNFSKVLIAKEPHLSQDIYEKNSSIIFSQALETDLSIKTQKLSTATIANFPPVIAAISTGATLSILIFIIGAVVVVIFFIPRIVQIDQDEVGIVYKKFGSPLPSNHQIALNGEIGWQIDTLSPGEHPVSPFWMYEVIKEKAIHIDTDEIGLVEAKDGCSLEPGQMFGRVVKKSDCFQNGRAFIIEGGQRGHQLAILRNGIYRIHTKLFNIEKRLITNISDNEIGLVEAKDGKSLSLGKTFGDAVECRNFEDAQAFIDAGGYRGKQLNILTAGKYAINTELFKIKRVKPINIEAQETGLVDVGVNKTTIKQLKPCLYKST